MKLKRLLYLIPLLLLSALPAHAQLANARGWCEQGATVVVTSGLSSTTTVQGSFPSCVISVSVHGGGAATIYSTGSSTPLSNPFTASPNGQWIFYAANGEYDITMTGGGLPSPVTYSDIFIVNSGGIPGSVTSVSCGNLPNVFTCSVANPTTTPAIAFAAVTSGTALDCSTFPGADIGAKWNACAAAASNGAVISLANFTSPQTMTTAVTITKPITTFCGGITVNQQAAILIGDNTFTTVGTSLTSTPDQICTFNKTANIDQLTLDGSGNFVSFVNLIGNRGSGRTGNGLIATSNAFNPIVYGVFITGEAGNDVTDAGGNSTYRDVILADYGTNGMVISGFLPVVDNTSITDAADSTGNAVSSTAVIAKFSDLNANTLGNAAVIHNEDRMYIVHSFLVQNNGWPAYTSTAGSGTLSDSFIQGGGTHGPAVFSTGNLWLNSNPQIVDTAAADIVQAGGGVVNITGNTFIFTRHSNNSAVNLNFVPTIGAIVSNNVFQFNTGDVPTGDNYAVRMTVQNAGDFLQNVVVGNVVNGNNKATDHGFFYDNSLVNITSNFNEFNYNQCVDLAASACIVRTDPNNNHNVYQNNSTNLGTGGLFAAGGSTGDVIVSVTTGFTFATLPTTGNGSQVYCSDCTAATPTAGSGVGAMLFRLQSVWSGGSVSGTGAATSTSKEGITNFNRAAQSQVTVSATEYYITRSDLDMPAVYTTPIAAGTTMKWRIALTKTAAGTGTFQILLKKGVNGSTADTSIVTQTIGTQTAAVDNMEADIQLTWTSTTAAYWTIVPRQSAASGVGFGLVYPATAAQFSGTIAGQTTTTASDKYGLSVIFTTGTPTFVVNEVSAQAFGVN